MKRMRTRDTRGPVIVFGAIALCALLFAQKQFAQQQSGQAPYPQQQYGQQPSGPLPPQGAVGGSTPQLSSQQLEDLTAPIALYPDTLLSEILVASTYPLEVVEAQQWLSQHQNLKGKKLMEEAQHQNWDPSVQALVAFPGVLARLNQDVRWTTDLGNAFLAQQADVMAAVQRLRGRAQSAGKLQPGPQENITTSSQNGQSAIQIQPTNPEDVYVPDYNPAWAWGPPVYGAYPPLPYPPIDAGLYFDPFIDLGFYFGGGWGLWGGFGWGWGPDWFGGGIFLNVNFFHRFGFRDFHPGFGGSNVWRTIPPTVWECPTPAARWQIGFMEPKGCAERRRFAAMPVAAPQDFVRRPTSDLERRALNGRTPARTTAPLAELAAARRPAYGAIMDFPAWATQASAVVLAAVVSTAAAEPTVAEGGDEHAQYFTIIGTTQRGTDGNIPVDVDERPDIGRSSAAAACDSCAGFPYAR